MQPVGFIPGRNGIIRNKCRCRFRPGGFGFGPFGKIIRVGLFEKPAGSLGFAKWAVIFEGEQMMAGRAVGGFGKSGFGLAVSTAAAASFGRPV